MDMSRCDRPNFFIGNAFRLENLNFKRKCGTGSVSWQTKELESVSGH
jgi:hypothetical protein